MESAKKSWGEVIYVCLGVWEVENSRRGHSDEGSIVYQSCECEIINRGFSNDIRRKLGLLCIDMSALVYANEGDRPTDAGCGNPVRVPFIERRE